MALTELRIKKVLDHTVTSGVGLYEPFDYVAFVFKSFTGLTNVNNIALASIPSGTSNIEVETSPHKIKWSTMGVNWNIPSGKVAKYVYSGDTYIVVFGSIGSNGIPNTTLNSCGTDILVDVDSSNVPTSIYGCRLEGKTVRSDCDSVVTIYDLGGSYLQGQLPVS